MVVWRDVVCEIGRAAVLLWLALRDKKCMELSRKELILSSALLLASGFLEPVGWQVRAGGAAFGAVLLLFSYFSKEAFGFADGIVVFVCGVVLGLYDTVLLCFFATLYSGGYSAVLLLMKKAGRKSRIPFLPFLLLGYLTMRILVNSMN